VVAKQRALAKKLASAVDALQDIGLQSHQHALTRSTKSTEYSPAQIALDEQRQRLVDTARTLEGIARRKAAAIREQRGRAHARTPAGARAHALDAKAHMMSLFQLVPGSGARMLSRSERRKASFKSVSEADVLSHVDDWEEAQRHEMHDEDGFQLLSPAHGDMAAASGRGSAGVSETDFFSGKRAGSVVGARSKKITGVSQFHVRSRLGHRGGLEEESDKDASSDLMHYYHALQLHTKKTPLKHGPPNLRVDDGAARDDLDNFYDDEAAQEGLEVNSETGLRKGQTDPLYDLAANGNIRTKHSLHRESAGQARNDLGSFYKNLGRGFPKISPSRPRFKSSGEARKDLFDDYFGKLTKKGKRDHVRGHGWESTKKARSDLFSYFGQPTTEGRHGNTHTHTRTQSDTASSLHELQDHQADKDLSSFYNNLDASSREYSREERQKREVNVEGLSSKSANNDLDFFYDHLAKGAADAEKLHTKPSGFVLPKV